MIVHPEGIKTLASLVSVSETIARIEKAVADHGLTLFAHIDHTGAAASVGLKMQPARVLIFGSPRAGTPLMVASPLLALDLPLKALVWQDNSGQVNVSYTDPAYLAERYRIPDDLAKNIAGLEPLLKGALQGQ
ncbi:MAG TPA: DUF302 domain-containing protein [Ktedonobacterales bacterium]|nr:DUF302 domain-containing protein [Ktedonobacterales bacterium]